MHGFFFFFWLSPLHSLATKDTVRKACTCALAHKHTMIPAGKRVWIYTNLNLLFSCFSCKVLSSMTCRHLPLIRPCLIPGPLPVMHVLQLAAGKDPCCKQGSLLAAADFGLYLGRFLLQIQAEIRIQAETSKLLESCQKRLVSSLQGIASDPKGWTDKFPRGKAVVHQGDNSLPKMDMTRKKIIIQWPKPLGKIVMGLPSHDAACHLFLRRKHKAAKSDSSA